MTSREELEAALRESAAAPTPPPDAAFVASLERRLLATERTNVVPIGRRARRMSATAVVVTSVVFAGAVAAAAGIAVTHPFRDDAPAVTTITTVAGTEPVTVLPVTTTVPVTVAPTLAATTVPVVVATVPRSTVAATLPPPTVAPTVAPSTTEVHTAAVIALACAGDGSAVQCSWSQGPPGTVRYLVLRSQPSAGNGRAYWVDGGATNWTDPLAAPGATASYLVHAYDVNGVDLGHSNFVSVGCC